MMLLLLFGSFFLLLALGVPILFSMGVSAGVYYVVSGYPLMQFVQKTIGGVDSFTLLAGDIMGKGGYLNREDFGILGALEVDTDFNVNILTGSSGEMRGGLGGGPDVAGGAQVSIVTIPVIRGRTPSIVKKVFTTCTPGETVAVVVTEAGIALNPKHKNYQELKEDLEAAGLKLVTIEELQQLAESMTGVPKPIETGDKVVCMVEYRDGSVVDVIRQIKK